MFHWVPVGRSRRAAAGIAQEALDLIAREPSQTSACSARIRSYGCSYPGRLPVPARRTRRESDGDGVEEVPDATLERRVLDLDGEDLG